MRRAIGLGARGARRRPNTGTLPGPHRIRTPGTCGPRASAKASGAWRSGRGVSVCRRQLPVPGPHPRGGVPLQGFSRGPTVGSETVSLVFRSDDLFSNVENPQAPGTVLIRPPHNPCSPSTDLQIGGLSSALPRNGLSANSTVIALNQPSLGAHFSFQECFLGSGRGCLSPRR